MNAPLVIAEQSAHAAAIEVLVDLAFGSDRLTKTTYRLREDVAPIAALGLVAIQDAAHPTPLLGTIRYWPVSLPGGAKTLLLGPIAIHPDHQGQGVGRALMQTSLDKARALGWQAVILVGDEPYYSRFGFQARLAAKLTLPGPVDHARFLALALTPGALDGVSGMVERA